MQRSDQSDRKAELADSDKTEANELLRLHSSSRGGWWFAREECSSVRSKISESTLAICASKSPNEQVLQGPNGKIYLPVTAADPLQIIATNQPRAGNSTLEGERRHKGIDMATNQMSDVLQHLRRDGAAAGGAGLTDGQLLEELISRRDEAALAALVRRHGPMVWGVCRRVLRNHHDAEDAFQATFLVLVRKAASITPREMVANWLYGVAHQTALKARATAAEEGLRERQVTEMPEPAVTEQDLWNDLQPLLDQELSRLPDKYRVAIVLCDLEGKTRKEAARQLGVPEGTLAARLAQGRGLLAKRLAQTWARGVGRGVGGGAGTTRGVGGRAGLGGVEYDQSRKPVCGGSSGGRGDLGQGRRPDGRSA